MSGFICRIDGFVNRNCMAACDCDRTNRIVPPVIPADDEPARQADLFDDERREDR